MSKIRFPRIVATAAILIVGLAFASQGAPALAQQQKLVSVKTETAPTMDGKVDESWSKAAPFSIELSKLSYEPANYNGMRKTKVSIRSLYDSENIYFLVQWTDPTQSLQRSPWVKQADGSWKMLQNLDNTGHENQYYEDKMAMLWNISTKGFETRGCAAVCHKARGGKNAGIADTSPGRKFTDKPGETLDMWHWKSVRTGSVGQFDDQYIDHAKNENPDWGRHGDSKTGGGYSDNINAAKTGPAFMNKDPGSPNKFWILASEKTDFVDTFKPGDVVAGIVVSPFTGSRADISSQSSWENGTWTVEFKRKLVTTEENAATQDVQFSDLKKAYFFGIAVFDNTQIDHLYHEGAQQLTFK